MRKRSPLFWLPLLVLALAAAVCLLYFPARSAVTGAKARTVEVIERAVGNRLALQVGKTRISLKRGAGFLLEDLVLSEKEGERREIFSAQSLFLGLDLHALVRGEIRILKLSAFRPRLTFTRDCSGKLNVEGLFSPRYVRDNLPVDLAEPSLGETFGPLLWRERVSLEQGEFVYRDASRPQAEVLWVEALDLDVLNRLPSDALSVELSGKLKGPLPGGSFVLAGEVRGWKNARRVSELFSSLSVHLWDVDLKGLAERLPDWRATDSLEGKLEARIAYDGLLLLPGKGRIELAVEQPFFRSDRVHTKGFRPSRLGLAAEVDARIDALSLADGELQLGDLQIKWGGDLRWSGGKLEFLNLSLQGDDLPLLEAKEYLPLRLLSGGVWPFLVDMARGGRVDIRSRLRGKPADFSRMDTPAGQDALYLWLRFRDVTVVLPVGESYLPFHSTSGLLELDSGTLFFRDFRTNYGQSPIPEIQGSILGIHQSRSHLRVNAAGQLALPEAVAELDHGIFPEVLRGISRRVREVSGSGSVKLQFDYSFGEQADEVLHVAGETSLRGAAARVDGLSRGLREISGTLGFSEKSVRRIDLTLKVGDSPIRVEGGVSFGDDQRGAGGTLKLTGRLLQSRDLLALLDRNEEVAGVLSGRAEIAWTDGAMQWSADLEGDAFQWQTRSHHFSGRALRLGVEGREGSIVLRDLKLVLEEQPLSVSGEWTSLRPLAGRVRLEAPALDMERLFRNKRTPQPWVKILDRPGGSSDAPRGKGLDLNAEVRIDNFRYRGLYLEDLDLRAEVRDGTLAVRHAGAGAGGGRLALKGECDLQDDRLPFSVLFSLSDLKADGFFRWFSVDREILDGSLFLEGSLRGQARPDATFVGALAGSTSFFCGPCTIQRYEILGKLLTLVNFTQWARIKLSDLNTRGVPCREIKGNLRFENGYLQTSSLTIDSSIAMARIQGRYDLIRDALDLDLSLKPMEPLDQVLDRLPVVGQVIPGPDGAMVGFEYRIEGPLRDAQVRLVPLKGLSDRISQPLGKINEVLRSLKERVVR